MKHTYLITYLTTYLINGINSYTLTFHDCITGVEALQKYDAKQICDRGTGTNSGRNQLKYLVQHAEVAETYGYSCSVTCSTFTFRCGAWSHLKLGAIPQIDHRIPVSTDWCNNMVQNRKFKTETSRRSFLVELNTENVIAFTDVGRLEVKNDHIECTGENYHDGTTMQTNVVRLQEYKVVIRPETYIVNGGVIESRTDHVKIPCTVDSRACETAEATFVWKLPDGKCPLQLVRGFRPERVLSTFLLDKESGLFINTTGMTKIMGCEEELMKTNYKNLYVVDEEQLNLPALSPTEIDINVEGAIRDDFLTYMLEQKIHTVANTLERTECIRQGITETPVRIYDNVYAFTKGDIQYRFTCKQRTEKIREAKSCFHHIPLDTDPPSFVDPATRVLIPHSNAIECDPRFPLIVQATESWVEINPTIRPVPAPPTRRPDAERMDHIDVTKGGLYTAEEIKSWERLISFPAFHSALLKQITYGSCVQSGTCDPDGTIEGVLPYELNRLLPQLDQLNPWTKIRGWIREYGDIMAFIVIIIVIGKILMDTTMIAMTLLKEGPGATIALITNLYLSNHLSYKKIRRRNQKLKEQDAAELQTLAHHHLQD